MSIITESICSIEELAKGRGFIHIKCTFYNWVTYPGFLIDHYNLTADQYTFSGSYFSIINQLANIPVVGKRRNK
ncbi:10 transmembrane domain protein, putative translocator [Paenibacillus curdlanolyticus YK9]|uniref:10 transmembrane domain protein, putative translocator n=1 Tax=Paenibacillus curdlanolyticus YK9 TaxID=717606 RepID=E0ID76_9BACL|nr:hypothetical protein [Paenibacillus curdlanolyticus]EFM09531.1 10 transmembrane domain protein, putative translocator [Paenibacillus curdlanolyticus YK9]